MLRVTPVVCPATVAARLGPSVVLKLEGLQRTGSFKVRGAFAKLGSLTAPERARGVVAASAGNHGLGVALAAGVLGIRAEVVVSRQTPAVKRDGIARLGAEVSVEGAGYDEAEAAARRRARDRGAVFVSAYDDEHVIRGNGDELAAELARQLPDLAAVIAPVGGGGLIGGLARTLAPRGVRVIGVQPRVNCAMAESLAGGAALTVYAGGETVAEGCEGAVAERTYGLARDFVDRIELVSEDAIRCAVAFAYRGAGAVIECSAAVALAGMLEGAIAPAPNGTTCVVLTGSNIEPALLDEILAGEPK
jgi:threonine dehydratase